MNNSFRTENLITYLGNKRKLIGFIEDITIDIKKELEKEYLTIFDGFSGSGVVSRMFMSHSDTLFVNDIEEYSKIINQCYLSNPDKETLQEIYNVIEHLNTMEYNISSTITNCYCPNDTNNIQEGERCFYTHENGVIIDSIRNEIDKYPQELQKYLLAPLLVKSSIHSNCSGVFKGFYKDKNTSIGKFGGTNENCLSRIKKNIKLDVPIFYTPENNLVFPNVFIYKEDTNKLIYELPDVDLVYYDPPYNQHPYGSNYFMLNMIINQNKYNKLPETFSKVSGIPSDWYKSKYNKKNHAKEQISELIQNTKSKYIIISYNNEGILSEEEMIECIGDLDFSIKKIEYNTFRGSRNLKNRNNKVDEILFVIKK
jgi:adenine-specific DNA-methyltransferase